MAGDWDVGALNFLTWAISQKTGGSIRWERIGGWCESHRFFVADFIDGSRLRLEKAGAGWEIHYISTTGRDSIIERGSKETVIQAAFDLVKSGRWPLYDIHWTRKPIYMWGEHPTQPSWPVMIVHARDNETSTLFCVEREDRERSFLLGGDGAHEDLLINASQFLKAGAKPRPSPWEMRTNLGNFPARLNLTTMSVSAQLPQGSLAFVFRARDRYEALYTDATGKTFTLGEGTAVELVGKLWTIPGPRAVAVEDEDEDDDDEYEDEEDGEYEDEEEDEYEDDDDDTEDDNDADDAVSSPPRATQPKPERYPRDIPAFLEAVAEECNALGLLDPGAATRIADPDALIHRAIDRALARVGGGLPERTRQQMLLQLRRHMEASPEPAPPPPPTPAELAAMTDLVRAHLGGLHGKVPAKVNGAASAHRIVDGVKGAFDAGVGDIEGTLAEVLAALRPYMDRVVSVRAAIDAFNLLEPISPLFGRRHSRCMMVLLATARDPGSEIAAKVKALAEGDETKG